MERAVAFWTLALCAILIGWLTIDVQFSNINYEIHHFLIDKKTGTVKKPVEILNMTKVINQTRKYIDETNSIERLHDLVYSLNLENPHIMDQVYSQKEQLQVSSWPVSNQTKCGQQLRWILNELDSAGPYALMRGQRGFELTQLVGSIGKPEAGVFASGATTWLGSYNRCQRLTMNQDQAEFKMRFCWSRLRPKWWSKNETIYPATVIRVGTCLPEACDSQADIDYSKEISRLVKFDWPEFYRDNFDFESLFCLPDERSPIRKLPRAGHYYLWSICAWLTLIVSASVAHEMIRHRQRNATLLKCTSASLMIKTDKEFESRLDHVRVSRQESNPLTQKVLEALSIHNNIKQFKLNRFRVKYSQLSRTERPRVDLSSFDSVKITMALLIVLGHGAYLGTSFSRSLANRVDMSTGFYGTFTLSIGRLVDTFFIFFGVLTSYNIMRKFNDKQLANPLIWIGINLGILLRISPLFVLVYLYARLIAPYTAASPWWDYGVMNYSMRGVCMSESWLKSIPYFGCTGSPSFSPCVPPAWFIVSYSQISIILPLITYIIIKLPSNRYSRIVLMAFLTIISVMKSALLLDRQTTIDPKSFSLYGGFIVNLLEKFETSGQMSALSRIGSVSIGCYVGYLLRSYELGHIKEWPRWLHSKLTLNLVIFLTFIVQFSPTIGYFISIYTNQRVSDIRQVIAVNSICIIIWPILNAILIICGTSIYNHVAFIRFFSHSFWHSFNKLGLCVYLIHWEILLYGLTSYEQGPSPGYVIDQVKLWTYSTIFTIIFSFFIHILIEAPLTQLLMILGEKFLASNKVQQSDQTNSDKKTYSLEAAEVVDSSRLQ